MTRSVAVIGAPSSAAAYAPGPELTPSALRRAGLLEELDAHGVDAVDLGDVTPFTWCPDRGAPLAMHAGVVARTAREVAGLVRRARDLGRTPVVLGGDCTVGIGTVAGFADDADPHGLLYFDPHPDLNTPETIADGAIGWMGVAHLLDLAGTVDEVAGLGPRRPLVTPETLLLFDSSHDRSNPGEREVVDRLGLDVVAEAAVAADPRGQAAEAAARLRGRTGRFLVHFDVDAIDFADAPLAENTDRNVGLGFDVALDALAVLLADPGASALTVAQLNPHHAAAVPGLLERFVRRLAAALATQAGAVPSSGEGGAP